MCACVWIVVVYTCGMPRGCGCVHVWSVTCGTCVGCGSVRVYVSGVPRDPLQITADPSSGYAYAQLCQISECMLDTVRKMMTYLQRPQVPLWW